MRYIKSEREADYSYKDKFYINYEDIKATTQVYAVLMEGSFILTMRYIGGSGKSLQVAKDIVLY
jgi:hypothetical protein